MDQVLGKAVEIIVKNINPDKILLFGSRAKNTSHSQSDYDLCILKSDVTQKRRLAQDIYKLLLGLNLPVDIIVETPENFNKLKTNPFLIYSQILANNEVLYLKNHLNPEFSWDGNHPAARPSPERTLECLKSPARYFNAWQR